VLPGSVSKAQVPVGKPIATVQGGTFTVDAGLAITDPRARKANITAIDILASNRVTHVIDKVILPLPGHRGATAIRGPPRRAGRGHRARRFRMPALAATGRGGRPLEWAVPLVLFRARRGTPGPVR
jgi:hypothetical protein